MELRYHQQMTQQALENRCGADILSIIITSNLGQDKLTYQIWHDHFHFDNNAFTSSRAYIEQQRAIILQTLQNNGDVKPAWQAFGRLLHTAQDFYAHSNYVALWLEQFPESWPPPEAIEPNIPGLLNHPNLHSGRIYLPLEALTYFPALREWVRKRLPHDSHAWMNLDEPERGAMFPYAFQAAKKCTCLEWENTYAAIQKSIGQSALQRFTGKLS